MKSANPEYGKFSYTNDPIFTSVRKKGRMAFYILKDIRNINQMQCVDLYSLDANSKKLV